MTKEELREFLKDNLTLTVTTRAAHDGDTILKVTLFLPDEEGRDREIASDYVYIKERD